MTKGDKSSYRQIMKATSIFGGVQIIEIFISIIRSKFVAIFLGPAGLGIVGLLNSTITIISNLTNFGLKISAVKNIAASGVTQDQVQIATTVSVLRRLVWVTGSLGLIFSFIAAPWLSQLTFGNSEFTFAFRWLSITFLFGQISNGQLVILQGLRKIQYLAKANLTGNIIGLFFTLPIYYFWGIDGIVPVLLISSVISLLVSFFFSNKIKIIKVQVSARKTLEEGKNMLSMGIMISLTGLMGALSAYIIRIYISGNGDLIDVGLYTAGFALMGTYTNLIFTAITKDYYPRLSEVSSDEIKTNSTVTQQAEIAILILLPLLVGFLIFTRWIIILFYSHKFLPLLTMIHWAVLGIFFKAASWSISFIFFAKGASKWIFWNELIVISYMLIFNIIGYKYFGLEGLGISFLLGYVFALAQNYFLTNRLYNFRFEKYFFKGFSIVIIIGILAFLTTHLLDGIVMYILGTILLIISTLYSYRELDKKMGIVEVLNGLKNKYLKK